MLWAIIFGIGICFFTFMGTGSKSHLVSGCVMVFLLLFVLAVAAVIFISEAGF